MQWKPCVDSGCSGSHVRNGDTVEAISKDWDAVEAMCGLGMQLKPYEDWDALEAT